MIKLYIKALSILTYKRAATKCEITKARLKRLFFMLKDSYHSDNKKALCEIAKTIVRIKLNETKNFKLI